MNLYNYNLNENSIIFDIGGYHGNWASEIIQKYNPHIYIFEPVKEYYNYLSERFKHNPKVNIFNVELFNEDCIKEINISNDGTSLFSSSNNKTMVNLKRMTTILKELNITTVNLMEINIEGSEYLLLKDMISENLINVFEHILIQYHCTYPNYIKEREEINLVLNKTHQQTFCEDYVWEGWSIK